MTNKQIISRSIFLLSLMGVAASVSGCAQDVGIIDRTRPDYVKQSMFMNDDEWYFAQSVVGSDFQDSPGVTIGWTTPLKRIRWTVTEDTLFAYSTVEPSVGTSKGLRDPKDRRLGVVAAFPIKSHFDIQRGYNSSTGQVSNVISENSSDRLWYDREYMRVDWANNQVTDFGFLDGFLSHISAVNRVVPEADSPADYNRTRVSNDIIDTVTEYYVEPNPYQCYNQFAGAYSNCEAGPLSLRNFFWKIKSHDAEAYEPMLYSDYVNLDKDGKPVGLQDDGSYNSNERLRVTSVRNGYVECDPDVTSKFSRESGNPNFDLCQDAAFPMFKRFGFFTTRRNAYTPRRNSSPFEHQYNYAERWNIWQNSFETNPDGSYVMKDGHKVAIPLEKRKPKQIVYYLSPGFPEDRPLIFDPKTYDQCGTKEDSTEKEEDVQAVCSLQESWNKVFTHTVALTRNREECNDSSVSAYLSSSFSKVMKFPLYIRSGLSSTDKGAVETFVTQYYDQALDNSKDSSIGHLMDDGVSYLQSVNVGSATGWDDFCKVANKQFEQVKSNGDKFNCEDVLVTSKADLPTLLARLIADYASSRESNPSVARKALSKFVFYSGLIEKLARYGAKSQLQGADGDKFQKGVCDSKFPQQFAFISGVTCDDAAFEHKDVCEQAKTQLSQSFSENFDPDNAQTKKDIAASNNGSDHMFVIKPNSCSWSQLRKWYKEHGNLNSNVQSLFADNKDRLDSSKPNALPVEDLLKLCAKLEWYTKDDPNPKNRFDWQRFGDLRYSFINWVYENTGGWLGLGPVFADPVTGEIVSGVANFSGNFLDHYAAYATDLNLYTNGTLSDDDIISGRYLNDEKDALKNLGFNNAANYLRAPDSLTQKSRLNSADYDKTFNILNDGTSSAPDPQQVRNQFYSVIDKSGGINSLMAKYAQYRKLVDNNVQAQSDKIVKFMSRPENISFLMKDQNFSQLYDTFKSSFTANPTSNTTANTTELPLEKQKELFSSLFSPIYSQRRQDALQRKYQMMNMFTGNAFKESLHSLPELIGSSQFYKDWPRDKVEKYITKKIFLGTELHELGHTMGLRHNFSGSSDALNYPPAYWDVRAALRKSVPNATQSSMKDVNELIKPELDLLTAKDFKDKVGYELKNNGHKVPYFSQGEYRNSSIMDYGAAPNSDFAGLGRYDDAAIQFAYAKRVQVFDDSVSLSGVDGVVLSLHALDYRKLPNLFSTGSYSFADSYQAEQDGVDKMVRHRKWIPIEQAQKEYVQRVDDNTSSFRNSSLDSFSPESDNAVPYAFCSDEFNHIQDFCATFDYGATMREILGEKLDTYRALGTFFLYRKDTVGSPMNYLISKLISTLSRVQEPFIRYTWLKRVGLDQALDLGSDSLAATIDGVNFMGELIAKPEPGDYCAQSSTSNTVFRLIDQRTPFGITGVTDVNSCSDALTITRKNGAPFEYSLNRNSYLPTLDRAGAFVEKYFALQSFFFIRGYDIRSLYNTDASTRNYSFWTEFQGSVYTLVHDLLLGNNGVYEGVVDDHNQYQPPELVSPKRVKNPGAIPEQQGMPRVFNWTAYNMNLLEIAIVYQLLVNNTPYDSQNNAIQYMKVCATNVECEDVCGKQWSDGTQIECKTFTHPDVPQVYTAPIAKDGRSITGDIIDHLNDVKGLYLTAQAKWKANPNDIASKQNFDSIKSEMQYYISILDLIRNLMIQTRGLY